MARTTGATIGPAGRNVLIDNPESNLPIFTKDGVTVAKSLNMLARSKTANLGALLVIDAANLSCEKSGDGTTTCTLLADAIVQGGRKLL